jgi:Zn-dependent protease with chaperone function
MNWAALTLLLLGVVLAEPASRVLAAASWPARDPVGGLLLWQAVGLSGGLALLGSGLLYGLSPFGTSMPAALPAVAEALVSGQRPAAFGTAHWLALLATVLLALRLVGVLLAVTVRTLRNRARHRDLLDLVGTPWPAVPGTHVLDHPVPVAYCLPGLKSRLVVSAGTLNALDPDALLAVLEHERAHLRERHDLVVLPFVAWGATAPFVRGMVGAQLAVAMLVEMRADDVASGCTTREQIVEALRRMHRASPAAAAGLTSFSVALDERLDRILAPPAPLPRAFRVLVRLAAVGLVTVPVAALLLG